MSPKLPNKPLEGMLNRCGGAGKSSAGVTEAGGVCGVGFTIAYR